MPVRRRVRVLLGVAAATAGVVVGVAPPASAAAPYCTVRWLGGSGSWGDDTRWSTGQAPRADDFVCVLRGDAPTAVVTLDTARTVAALAIRGAALRAPRGTSLTTGDLDATRATLTGAGTVTGEDGELSVVDSTLGGGVHLVADGSLFLGGVVTLAGGATLDQPDLAQGLTRFADVTEVRDGDGHPANHLAFGGLSVAVAGSLTVGVPLAVRGVSLEVTGTARLRELDELDASGRLQADPSSYVVLSTAGTGTMTLPRKVTAVGPGALVEGGALRTPTDDDALTDLTTVQGGLALTRDLTVPHPLDVSGALRTTATLRSGAITVHDGGSLSARSASSPPAAVDAPSVTVDARSTLDALGVSGQVVSAGTNGLSGATLGSLQLGPPAATTLSAAATTTVTGAATVAGRLTVGLPPRWATPPDGTRLVLLSAAGGVTGRFGLVRTVPSARGSVTLEYTPTQVVAVFHAPPG